MILHFARTLSKIFRGVPPPPENDKNSYNSSINQVSQSKKSHVHSTILHLTALVHAHLPQLRNGIKPDKNRCMVYFIFLQSKPIIGSIELFSIFFSILLKFSNW